MPSVVLAGSSSTLTTQWSVVGMASLFVLLQHASLFAALGVLSPIRCVLASELIVSELRDDRGCVLLSFVVG